MINFFKNHFNFSASIVFFFFLYFFQYPFFDYQLGVLTSYVNNFNALNEITFWSSFFGDSFIASSSLNPLKLNVIAWLLFLMSQVFSQSLIFSFAPIIFTTLSFLLALKIFELYKLQKSWALLLAFFGMTSISTMPLLQTLTSFLTLNLVNQSSYGGYFDLLASFSSSLVLLVFLGLLFLTLKAQIFNLNYRKLLPSSWALSVLIHPSLFIFGYPFIIYTNLMQLRRLRLKDKPINVINFLLVNIAPLLFAIPYVLYNISFFGSNAETIIASNPSDSLSFFKAIFFYFAIPLCLMFFANRIFKVDPFESFVRFWPIFLIALIEILLRTLQLIHLLPIDDQVILNRVSVYFLHFFYYLPFLAVITREFTYLPDIHDLDNNYLKQLRKLLNFFFIRLGPLITFVLIALISTSTYLSIDHEPYKIVDERAKILSQDIQEILADASLNNKEIQFLSMDEKIISSFLFPNAIASNIFIDQGSSSKSKELDFLQGIYHSFNNEPASDIHSLMLAPSFSKNSFDDHSRNLTLLLWLKYNNTYYNTAIKDKMNTNNKLKTKIFFQDNYLVSHHDITNKIEIDSKNELITEIFFQDNDLVTHKLKQVGKHIVTYTQ